MKKNAQGFFVPFRYKLSLLITFVLVLVMGGCHFLIREHLKAAFTDIIQQRFARSETVISQLLEYRLQTLSEWTGSLRSNIKVLSVTQPGDFTRKERDKILQDEVLPKFPRVSFIVIQDINGNTIASTIAPSALERNAVKEVGKDPHGEVYLLFYDGAYYQVLKEGLPSEGRKDLEVLIGSPVDQYFTEKVHEAAGIDIAFVWRGGILKDDIVRDVPSEALVSLNQMVIDQLGTADFNSIHRLEWNGEDYLYTLVSPKSPHIPKYILVESLDKQLAFAQALFAWIFAVGCVGVLIGSALSFLLARQISRPVGALAKATEEIEAENFDVRVNLQTHDEFHDLGESFNRMAIGLGEKQKLRGLMDKVVSKEIASELIAGEIHLGGELREASILFSDIREFTSLSEEIPPQQLLNLLNAYFTEVTCCIEENSGVIDKFIGDALMALFGVPLSRGNDAEHAILAALDMQDAVDSFNQRLQARAGRSLKVGVGICSGSLVAGNMGAENRLNYTVVGDIVNLASRLEGLTKHYQVDILVDEQSKTLVEQSKDRDGSPFYFRRLDRVQVKGKVESLNIYQVLCRSQQDPAFLKALEEFAKGQELLKTKKFSEAAQAFQRVHDTFPHDSPSRIFLGRALRYQASPALFQEENPDGAFLFREK